MQDRERRLAENEVLFREVNERTSDVNEAWSTAGSGRGGAPPFQILCECGSETCAEPLTVTSALYEAVRAHGARFLIAAGHALLDVEQVVEQHGDVHVVEKTGISARYAEQLDPRERGDA